MFNKAFIRPLKLIESVAVITRKHYLAIYDPVLGRHETAEDPEVATPQRRTDCGR